MSASATLVEAEPRDAVLLDDLRDAVAALTAAWSNAARVAGLVLEGRAEPKALHAADTIEVAASGRAHCCSSRVHAAVRLAHPELVGCEYFFDEKTTDAFLAVDVSTLADVERRLQDGTLTDARGIGPKRAEAIAEMIDQYYGMWTRQAYGHLDGEA